VRPERGFPPEAEVPDTEAALTPTTSDAGARWLLVSCGDRAG
jgi:hypothetical protein